MIIATREDDNDCESIILKPNRSASWQTNQWVLIALGLLLGLISGGFFLAGIWLAPLFAAITLAALAMGLYLTCLFCDQQTVILFSDYQIVLEKGRNKPQSAWVYQRLWARLIIQRTPGPLARTSIWLRDTEKRVEIGEFLCEPEKQQLIAHLRPLMAVPPEP